jgi:4,5-DOPA dioxygenase extradiol
MQNINNQNHEALINYQKAGKSGLISVNSAEHYLPLLYILALQEKNEKITYYNDNVGNSLMDVFMRCVKIG